MHCIIYRFVVKPGEDQRFIAAWSEVTQAFLTQCGSLGSRLHHVAQQEYISYAQWPSREAFDSAEFPAPIKDTAPADMRACCDSIETLYELLPVSDHLKPAPPDHSNPA